MADLHGFDANQVDPTTDFEPIPAGKYLAVITDSEMKPNKAGTGRYLQLAFQIIDGPYKKRFLWTRLSLYQPNATPSPSTFTRSQTVAGTAAKACRLSFLGLERTEGAAP